MNESEVERIVQFLKAIADRTRLRLLGFIAEEERSVEELACLLSVKEPTVSHHLNKLKELELVTMRREENSHLYRLNQKRLSGVLKELSPGILPEIVQEEDGSAYATKVLNTFLVEGKLTLIPAQHKKRLVILKRLAAEFDTGRAYTEQEVNETLKRFHPDCATLRREFIACGLMERANSVYQRL